MRHHEPFARLGEIVQQLARREIVDQRAHRNGQVDRRAIASRALAAFAMASALGLVFRIEAEMQQGIVMRTRDKNNVPAATAIAAARASARDKLLAPEREAAVAPVPRFDVNLYFVDEHEKSREPCLTRGVTSF